MKAYNIDWIYNRIIRLQADRWRQQGLLTDQQAKTIHDAYPVAFRTSNAFVEIGAFLFTNVAVAGGYALLGLFLSALIANQTGIAIFNTVMGVGLILLNQYLIRSQSLYRSGVDNALVVSSAALLVMGINVALPNEVSFWLRCLVSLPILGLAVWYYGDTIVTFIALLTLYAAVFDGLLTFDWGKTMLPFAFMLLSGLIYVVCHFAFTVPTSGPGRRAGIFSRTTGRRAAQTPTNRMMHNMAYYDDAITISQWIALSMFMISGNYFIVREFNGQLLRPVPAEAPEINLPWLFWATTVLIPAAYAYLGLRHRNRVFLILAGVGLAGVVATVRYYVGILPLSVHLSLSGLLTIGFASLLIWYLRRPGHETHAHGFTDVPDDDSPREFFLNAETLATIQATSSIHQPDGVKFGGGDFGGGGSGSKY
jgi:uncharacterized membrane protein YgcG